MSITSLLGITTAYAANAAPAGKQGFTSMLLMLGFLVFFMYFFIIRPQTRRAKEQRSLLAEIKKGDEVITSGGIIGKINKVADNFVTIDIAEGVVVTLQKAAISATLPKGTIKSI